MASLVETKAVSLRKGNHSENMAFTGVQGEVVVDLGYSDENGNLGTDVNTTLRLHNGITKSGIPMARADLLNVSSQLLAENREIVNDKNLAYADLSNLESLPSEDTSSKNKVLSTLSSYGLAIESEVQQRLDNKVNLNTDNLNTVYLTSEEIHDGQLNGNKPLAYADTSNINTRDLATPGYHSDSSTGNKPLAYNDTSNINTSSLTDATIHDSQDGNKPLAYHDFSNANTNNLTITTGRPAGMSGPALAKIDLSNVDPSILYDIISGDVDISTLERIYNKDTVIDDTNIANGHYPETRAVVQYIESKSGKIQADSANKYLTNVENWENLYSTYDGDVLYREPTLIQSQTGFEVGVPYNTGIYLRDDPLDFLSVTVSQVDETGGITGLTMEENVGNLDISSMNPFVITSGTNVDSRFTLTSTENGDGTYTYQIGSIITAGSGFEVNNTLFAKSTVTDNYYKILYRQLQIIPTMVANTTDAQGTIGEITQAVCNYTYGATSVNEQSVTITSATNTTARFSIASTLYNRNPAAGLLKVDLTNLTGMTATDEIIEGGSPWRIRHDEPIPSTSQTTIPNEQDYTIATNGNVWRALKQIDISSMLGNIPSVTFKAKFIPNTSYTTDNSTLFDHSETNFIMDSYGHSTTDNYKKYLLLPNHEYNFIVYSNNSSDNYMFTTGNVGSTKTIEYSIASITFNTNVQTATLNLTRNDGKSSSRQISNGTVTICISNDTNWSISKEGYSSVSDIINVVNGDQTINVTLDEES